MKVNRYIALDTETGGIGHEVSLLSAHFAVCDEQLNILDELPLLIKPNTEHYVVTAEALSINKINLIEHDKVALKYSVAGGKLREFLQKNSDDGKIKLIPIGKNVGFDIIKINDNILGKNAWNYYVSYRLYDITSLIIFLKRKGKLPSDAPDSLEKLMTYFNISQEAHTARGDTLASIEVVKKLEAM